MNSILKIFSRQTEQLLRLTKTTIHASQLQKNLAEENISKENDQCAFSYDLSHELRLIRKHLKSTCFAIQRALYRAQASRQIRGGDLSIEINDEIIFKYEGDLSRQLNDIQQIIRAVIDEKMSMNSPLNSLQSLFKQIEENFEILLHWIPRRKSTLYLGYLVSDTLERFYWILGALARLAKDIDRFERK